jgi:hypothetical protein
MRRRVVCAIIGFVVGVLGACASYSSGNDAAAPAEAGAEAGAESSVEAGDAAVEDAGATDSGTRFYCPPPAYSCAFLSEVCCYGTADAGTVGTCKKAGETCASSGPYFALCDSSQACRSLYDGAASAACCNASGNYGCSLSGCPAPAFEACNPTVAVPECADASASCQVVAFGYGNCR